MWIVLAFGSAFFAGITSILAKIGIDEMDSTLATAIRTVVVLLFAWLMVFITGAQAGIKNISAYTLLFLILSGLATGGSWLCYFRALQLGDVNKVVPVDKSSTILTMLLAILFLGEGVSVLKVLCMALIGVGTYLMIDRQTEQQGTERREPGSKMWLVYAILSAVFAALVAILGKVGMEEIDSNLGTAIRTVVVLVMAWAIVFGTGQQREIRHIKARSWVFLLLSGLATGASWLFYYKALQQGPASVVVPIDKLSILMTVLFAYFALGEKLSKKSGTGLAMLTGGTLLLLLT